MLFLQATRAPIVVAIAVVVGIFAIAAPADAHAYIVQSTPAAGSRLAQAPARVTIQFDEPITLPDGPAIEVVDSAGRRVDRNDAAVDPNDVTAVVARLAQLRPGSYRVSWRVVSADTHVVHGTFAFGYGAAAGTATAAEYTLFDPSSSLASIVRWVSLTAILAAVGALFFRLFFRPVTASPFTDAAAWQIRCGCALALLANAGLFVVQSAASAGSFAGGATGSALVGTLHSPFGLDWLVRIVAIVTIWACSVSRAWIAQAIGACAAVVILITLTVAGHAAGVAAFGPRRQWPSPIGCISDRRVSGSAG